MRLDAFTWTKPVTTIKINGHDVPAPERVAPPKGIHYWMPSVACECKFHLSVWVNDDFDARCLSRGIVHLTEEAAAAHAEALLSFTEVRDA